VPIDDTAKDAAGLGIPVPESEPVCNDYEVWEENWDVVCMFLRMQTQWRVGMAGATGLDYNVFKWFFDMYEVTNHKEMIEGLQTMEIAVLDSIAKT